MSERTSPDVLRWLEQEWLHGDQPTCLIRGFSGIGKSRIARQLATEAQQPSAYVEIGNDGATIEDVLLTVASQLENNGVSTMADNLDDLFTGIEKALGERVLVILDNFDELLEENTSLPPSSFIKLVQNLARHKGRPGRLLLITNQSLPQAVWTTGEVVNRFIRPPSQDEAETILINLLAQEGLESEIPSDDIPGVVRWLGGNPRAMQGLVECLRYDCFSDLVQLDPTGWELRDSAAAPQLVARLEERFLDRTLSRLNRDSRLLLELLSVYRGPFDAAAIDRLKAHVMDAEAGKRDLINRFLVTREQNRFELNPIARELCLTQIMKVPRRFKLAQSNAADHFARHFTSTGFTGPNFLERGAEFVEAKYHLLKAGRESEFEAIASDYRNLLLRMYGNVTRLPAEQTARTQLLATLIGALSGADSGFTTLRALLAQLLLDRGEGNDEVQALRQLRIATSNTRDLAPWVLRVRLTGRHEGPKAADAVGAQALDRVASSERHHIYLEMARSYEARGLDRDGIRVLERALADVYPRDRLNLYARLAHLLCRHNRSRDAIKLLLAAYQKHGAIIAGYSEQLELALFIANSIRSIPILEELSAAIEDASTAAPQRALGRMFIEQQRGDYRRAAEGCAAEAMSVSPRLAAQVAFGWLSCGEVSRAQGVVSRFPLPNNPASLWLLACVYYCADRRELALETLERLSSIDSAADTDIQRALLEAWDTVSPEIMSYPAFYFPVLPSSFTGLDVDLHRLIGRSSALSLIDYELVRLPRGAPVPIESPSIESQPTRGNGFPNSVIINQIGAASVSKYQIGKNIGPVGDKSSVENLHVYEDWLDVSGIDKAHLTLELRRLQKRLEELAVNDGQRASLEGVSDAIDAIEAGDVANARSRLARAGTWAVGVATSIGATLAATAIRSAIGM